MGSAGAVTAAPQSSVSGVTAVPPAASNVSRYAVAVHCARTVRFEAGIVAGTAGDHPANMCPGRVGLAGAETAEPNGCVRDETALPPAESNVTV